MGVDFSYAVDGVRARAFVCIWWEAAGWTPINIDVGMEVGLGVGPKVWNRPTSTYLLIKIFLVYLCYTLFIRIPQFFQSLMYF